MNRKEYKLMVEGWQGYLNEIAVNITGINKIKGMVDNLHQIRQGSGRDIKIVVGMKDKDLFVKLVNLDNSSNTNNVFFRRVLDNDFKLTEDDVNVKDDLGNKRDAWQVMWSEAAGGYGPLLYEVGIEVISCDLNGAVMSDRGSVSDDARKVWDRYKKRAESEFNLTAVKMDINDASFEDYYDSHEYEFENMMPDKPEAVKMQKMTPHDPTDDMYQFSAIDDMANSGEFKFNWNDVESSLAYAFYKKSPEIIDYLKDITTSDFDLDLSIIQSDLDTDMIKINLQN
jgi:hypothetical protein